MALLFLVGLKLKYFYDLGLLVTLVVLNIKQIRVSKKTKKNNKIYNGVAPMQIL